MKKLTKAYFFLVNKQSVLLLLIMCTCMMISAQTTFYSKTIHDETNTQISTPVDVNQDGAIDILTVNGNLYWLENDGHENFTSHQVPGTLSNVTNAAIGDFNQDGKMDIVATYSFPGEAVAWYENDGNENFTEHIIDNLRTRGLYVIDLDGNGTMDIISGHSLVDGVYWYENDGGGNFTKKTISSTFQGVQSVHAADLDNDGDNDIAVVNIYDKVAWFENDGNENFTLRSLNSSSLDGTQEVHVDDITGDGLPDIMATSLSNRKIVWYKNQGGGAFTRKTLTSNYWSPHCIYTLDWEGDGDRDLITTSAIVSKVITIWENDGTGNFTSNNIINNFPGRDVHAIDIDEDGDLDIIGGRNNRVDLYIACSSSTDGDMDGFASDCDCNDGNPNIYPGATQSCNNEDNDCNGIIDAQDLNYVDVVPPTEVLCHNPTVQLDGNGVYTFIGTDVFQGGMDDCSTVSFLSASPTNVSCIDVGSIVDVVVTAQDDAGNTASCIANVVVQQGASLPTGWQSTDVGQPGMGNDYTYGPCDQVPEFTLTGGGNNTTNMRSDNVAFSSYSICGDGSITAKIESISAGGYGGLMIRESKDAEAKQVSIFSNMTNNLRHESRNTTNGMKQVNQFFKPSPIWLKLERQGNWVFAYYSSTGTTFQYIHAVYVPMQSCVEFGLASFTYIPGSQTEAVFNNVSITGSNGGNGGGNDVLISSDVKTLSNGGAGEVGSISRPSIDNGSMLTINCYPNPNNGQFTIQMDKPLQQSGVLTIYSHYGQQIQQQILEAGFSQMQIDLGQAPNGMYLLEFRDETAHRVVKKFTINRS